MTTTTEPARTRVRRTRTGLVLLTVVVLAGLASWAVITVLQQFSNESADYPGPGSGEVVIEVAAGDTASDIGQTLVKEDVVASGAAFVDAAVADERSLGIQPGFYELKLQMSASDALELLLDPSSRVETSVTVPEGLRIGQAVDELVAQSDVPRREFDAVLSDPKSLSLPPYAEDNAEGFLFPATYTFDPGATAKDMLGAMVARFDQAERSLQLRQRAAEIGITPREAVTIASLVQAEVAERDFGKAARVVYNRLAAGMPLQFDSTVNYALGDDDLTLDNEQLGVDSPYNTYANTGLPPGPINSPGEAALEAALNPPAGDWVYFVAVAPGSAATRFTADYEEFLQFKDDFYDQVP